MIRINLLAAERPGKEKKAAGGPPGAFQAYVFLALFGGGAAVLCGFLWFMKSSTIDDLDKQMATASKRKQELQAIKLQVEQYEAQKRTLDAKIQLIETLQSQQSGPVHMLDEVSRSLPEFLWLTSLEQAGGGLRFKGESSGLLAVADFMTKLQQAGGPACSEAAADRAPDRSTCYFESVELQSTVQQANLVQFEVAAQFRNVYPKLKGGPPPAAPAPAATASAPAAAAEPAAKPSAAPATSPAAPAKKS
jgi:type IV pilus assembly protein PilN